MFRKIITIISASVLIFALVGCGSNGDIAGIKKEVVELVTLPDYSEVDVTVGAIEVTVDEINEYIDYSLASYATLEPVTDRAVEYGDTVNIDFVGTIDGEKFEGGTSQEGGVDLEIGSGRLIPGFEDGIVGANVSDNFDLDLVFPEEYHVEDLAGKAVIFNVTVNSVSESVIPEISDELVAQIDPTVTTVDEYKEKVEGILLEQEQINYDNEINNQVLNYIIENSVIAEIPSDEIQKNADLYVTQMTGYAEGYGVSMEEFLESSGMTMELFEEQSLQIGEDITKEKMVIASIAKAEKINVKQSEIDAFVDENYSMSGLDSKEVYLDAIGGEEELELYLITEKVIEAIRDNGIVTEVVSD